MADRLVPPFSKLKTLYWQVSGIGELIIFQCSTSFGICGYDVCQSSAYYISQYFCYVVHYLVTSLSPMLHDLI